jgi:hypothetical protein
MAKYFTAVVLGLAPANLGLTGASYGIDSAYGACGVEVELTFRQGP